MLQFDPSAYSDIAKQKRQAQQQIAYAPLNSINQTAQTVSGTAQDIQAEKDKQKQEQMQQFLMQQKQQQMGQDQQKSNYEYGQPIDSNQQSVGPQPQPMLGKSSFMPGGQGQVASPSPLIDRFKQWQSQGMPKQSAENDFMPAMGKEQRDQYQKQNAPITPYQQAELDQKDRMASLNSEKSVNSSGTKQDNEDKKRWDKIVAENDPYKASSRSPIGIARIGNLKADHVLPILQNPNATNQDINAGLAALDTVLQGGAATESGIHSQQYQTLAGQWADLKTKLTSKPQAVATPEIKQHLISMMQGLKQVNNQLMKDHMDYVESANPDLIQKNLPAWKNMRQRAGVDQPQSSSGLMWQGKPLKDTPANRAWLQQQQGGAQ